MAKKYWQPGSKTYQELFNDGPTIPHDRMPKTSQMNVLVFDFETTGLIPNFTWRLNQQKYLDRMPHAVQLAFTVSKPELIHYNFYLKVPVPIENVHIHGVTEEMSLSGVDFAEVFDTFAKLYAEADKVVSHNIKFDMRILKIECERRGLYLKLDESKHYCTMKEGANQWGREKLPKLSELYKHFYNKTPLNMHDASADVKACLRCFCTLKSIVTPSAEEIGL